jgi:hypothetical protein
MRWLMFFPCLFLLTIAPYQVEDSEDAIVKFVQQLGGRVQRDEEADSKPVVLVFLGSTKVTDKDIPKLKNLKTLRELFLPNTKVTGAGLSELKTLKVLILINTKLTDAGLKEIKGLQDLETLSLVGAEVTDEGIMELAGLKNLRELYLCFTKVTAEGVAKLKKALPKCDIVF